MKSVDQKLAAIRLAMKIQCIDAYIIPSSDPHMFEYLPAYWQCRQWLSDFTGSVGTLVVTHDFAGLWVDGRYWVQAEKELEKSEIQLKKLTQCADSTHLAWLAQHIKANECVGVNAKVLSIEQFNALKQVLGQDIKLNLACDLISSLWKDRPTLPIEPIISMCEDINALTRAQKINKILKVLNKQKVEAHLISSLDDIAWLLNCRGNDIHFNPLFLAHFYMDISGRRVLFINKEKISDDIYSQLEMDSVEIQPYESVESFLNQVAITSVLLDSSKVSIFHQNAFNTSVNIVYAINPSILFKATKYPNEIEKIRQTMVKDGVALCHFFSWLEQALYNQISISELTIDEQLIYFRQQQAGFIGASFPTIAGFNKNGALPHYRATIESYSMIAGQGLLLIDSGGQYECGTTDITRVVPIGQPNEAQCRDYTLVLKAHIALAQAVFPEGIAAPLLDAIGRQKLWVHQLDYRHGTGHGVGFALNVHEGPQAISYYAPIKASSAMRIGMVTSNEPGLYREGLWGVRIENVVVNKQVGDTNNGFGVFLGFETLTLCPIDLHCIQINLLDDAEMLWINQYHFEVRKQLAPHLNGEVLQWLLENTQPISR